VGTYPTGVKYRGINRAGFEYGDDWDGWEGPSDFNIPTAAALATELAFYATKGFNIIRLPISWERMQHNLGGSFDEEYKQQVLAFVNQANVVGWIVIIDLHNYCRYALNAFDDKGNQTNPPVYQRKVLGQPELTTGHLIDIWTKLATLFLGNPRVIFNLMNEPHDLPIVTDDWFKSIQAVINAIRATGATQLVLVPNSRGSDVTHWDEYAPGPSGGSKDSEAARTITDSVNNYAFDMHAYDMKDWPGSYRDQLVVVTEWAKKYGKRLFLSEMGIGNDVPPEIAAPALGDVLTYLNDNADVWMGWTAWNLSPYNLTPDNDYTADGPQMAWYAPYLTPNILTAPSGVEPKTSNLKDLFQGQYGHTAYIALGKDWSISGRVGGAFDDYLLLQTDKQLYIPYDKIVTVYFEE